MRFSFTCVSLALILSLDIANIEAATVTVFDNQFNGSWTTSDGGPVGTYTPDNIGDTFSNNTDATGMTWTVTQLTPQPWNAGGVIFAGGGINTGTMTTQFGTTAGHSYIIDWDTDLLGAGTTALTLTTKIYQGIGTGGPVISTQALGVNQTGHQTFVATGGPVTVEVALSVTGGHGSSDIQLNFMKATSVPGILVFDNQFNTTWDVDNDGNGSFESVATTYTPGSTNSRFRQTNHQQVWDVETMTPQPWNNGTIIFAGGGLTTGAIVTEFATVDNALYTIDWSTILIGSPTTHQLTATVFDGSGTGGLSLATQTLGTGQDNFFTFVGTGGIVTLEIDLTQVGSNGSSDIGLNHVTVYYVPPVVPEPTSCLLAACAAGGMMLLGRRRQRA